MFDIAFTTCPHCFLFSTCFYLFIYVFVSLFVCLFVSSFNSVLFHSSDEEWEQSKPITKEPKLSLEEVIIVTYSQLERTKYMKC